MGTPIITRQTTIEPSTLAPTGAVIVDGLVKTYETPDGDEFNAVDGMRFSVEV
jgi:hypothetical protein